MTTAWDDTPPDDCDAPESHPDGYACVRPGEEPVQWDWLSLGGVRFPQVATVSRLPQAEAIITVLGDPRTILEDETSEAFRAWMREREEARDAGLLFERGLGSGDDGLETDDELMARLKARLRQMAEAGEVAVMPGLSVRVLGLHEMTRDQVEEYAEMMGMAEPKETP